VCAEIKDDDAWDKTALDVSKETHKRDLQKRPTKETYKKDLQKRPTKEVNRISKDTCSISQKRLVR